MPYPGAARFHRILILGTALYPIPAVLTAYSKFPGVRSAYLPISTGSGSARRADAVHVSLRVQPMSLRANNFLNG